MDHTTCYRCRHPIAEGTAVCPECGLSRVESARGHWTAAYQSQLVLLALATLSAVLLIAKAVDSVVQIFRPSSTLWDRFSYSAPGAILSWIIDLLSGVWQFLVGAPTQATWRIAWIATLLVAARRAGHGRWRSAVLPIGLLVVGPFVQIDSFRRIAPPVWFYVSAIVEVVGVFLSVHLLSRLVGHSVGRAMSWAWVAGVGWMLFSVVISTELRRLLEFPGGVVLLATATINSALYGAAMLAAGMETWKLAKRLRREAADNFWSAP